MLYPLSYGGSSGRERRPDRGVRHEVTGCGAAPRGTSPRVNAW
jgi:hypothetical protein